MSVICRIIAAVLCAGVLTGCEEDGPDTFATASEPTDVMAGRRAACEATGGRWAPSASGVLFICYRNFSDANQPCSREGDCQGFCLARSRSCSPFEPLYGCHEVLSPGGLRQTVCVE